MLTTRITTAFGRYICAETNRFKIKFWKKKYNKREKLMNEYNKSHTYLSTVIYRNKYTIQPIYIK